MGGALKSCAVEATCALCARPECVPSIRQNSLSLSLSGACAMTSLVLSVTKGEDMKCPLEQKEEGKDWRGEGVR